MNAVSAMVCSFCWMLEADYGFRKLRANLLLRCAITSHSLILKAKPKQKQICHCAGQRKPNEASIQSYPLSFTPDRLSSLPRCQSSTCQACSCRDVSASAPSTLCADQQQTRASPVCARNA